MSGAHHEPPDRPERIDPSILGRTAGWVAGLWFFLDAIDAATRSSPEHRVDLFACTAWTLDGILVIAFAWCWGARTGAGWKRFVAVAGIQAGVFAAVVAATAFGFAFANGEVSLLKAMMTPVELQYAGKGFLAALVCGLLIRLTGRRQP